MTLRFKSLCPGAFALTLAACAPAPTAPSAAGPDSYPQNALGSADALRWDVQALDADCVLHRPVPMLQGVVPADRLRVDAGEAQVTYAPALGRGWVTAIFRTDPRLKSNVLAICRWMEQQ